MDRLRDFFYDYSDVLFSLVIASVMIGVVYINLTTIFDDTTDVLPEPHTALIEGSDAPDAPGESSETIVIDLDTNEVENDESPESGEPTQPDPSVADSNETPSPPVSGEMVTVTIPNGTPGVGIAQILVDHQLLPDTTSFVEAAENLNLSLKLKSGTFDIPAGTSPEQMVKIIAGQT